jgi:hypothetical protein
MSKYIEKALEEMGCGANWLVYLSQEYPYIDKISNLIQSNGHIFKDALVGQSALQIAADYLEKHVKEYGDKQPPKEENNYQYQPVFEKSLGDGTSTLFQGGLYTSKELAELEAEGRNKTIYKLLTILRLKKVD